MDGIQCTTTWYVDDVKISHVNKDLVAKVINGMECTFKTLTVNRRKKHTLLGMGISINGDKTMSINTSSYIKKSLEVFPEILKTGATSPANRNVFDIKERVSELSDKKRTYFIH